MEADEAAVLVGWSETKLRRSNAPRAVVEHRVTFLRSQLIASLKANHTYLLDEGRQSHRTRSGRSAVTGDSEDAPSSTPPRQLTGEAAQSMILSKRERLSLRRAFLNAPLEDIPLELPEATAFMGLG